MASGSFQANSMISRMPERGIELAIEEGGADMSLARVLASSGRNELPPLPVSTAQSHLRLAGSPRTPRLRTGAGHHAGHPAKAPGCVFRVRCCPPRPSVLLALQSLHEILRASVLPFGETLTKLIYHDARRAVLL